MGDSNGLPKKVLSWKNKCEVASLTFSMLPSTLTPSIEVPDKSCQPPDESSMLPNSEPNHDFKSQSSKSKFNAHRLLPAVSTPPSHQSEESSSRKNKSSEPRWSSLKLLFQSPNPSV